MTSLEGKFDLNALWWDDGTSGGGTPTLSKADNALNMNGTGEDWDGYAKLSKPGLGTEGEDKKSFISEGETEVFTLADFGIVGAFNPGSGGTLGVRGTSVNGGDSFKLVDTTPEFDPGNNPDPNDFPTWPQDISNVVLYFDQDAGDTNGDGYYLVKIDGVPGSANDDLDSWIDDVLAKLISEDPNISSDDTLLGAVIKGGNQATQFYAYGDDNPDADPIPVGAPGISPPPPQGDVDGNLVDVTYQYSIFGI